MDPADIEPFSPDTDTAIPAIVTVSEARRLLGGISTQTLYRLVRERELVIVKVRRRTFLRRADIEALIERSTRRKAP